WQPCPPDAKPFCDSEAWKHGGGSVWVAGSYEPSLTLTYWGVGNAGPDWNADQRPGDNLYTDSVVALDADTGRLKWHYQFTPHDRYDYDSVQVPVLADITWRGAPLKAMAWANRNGNFYVLDRETGKFLVGKPFVKVNWMDTFDERKWRYPMTDVTDSGILTTASDVLFTGGREGYFHAIDARTGSLLWKTNLGAQIVNGPITYEVDGRQYVAAISGLSLGVFGLRE